MTYNFKTQPRPYQQKFLEETKDYEQFAFLWDMGLGKSKVAIDTMSYLYDTSKIDSAIVVVRKSVIDNWFDPNSPNDPETEINKHLWTGLGYQAYSWKGYKTKQEERRVQYLSKLNGKQLAVYLINIEVFQSKAKATEKRMDEFFTNIDKDKTLIILDEAADIKNPSAIRTKAIFKHLYGCKYRRVLTGTPVTEAAEDCFSIYEFLQKGYLGFPTFWAFKNYFCVFKKTFIGKDRSFKQKIGYRNLDVLKKKLLNPRYASRLTKEEMLKDLPEKVFKKVYVDLTPEQQKLYDDMAKRLVAYIGDHELELTNTSQKIKKLLQISAGVLHFDETTQLTIEGGNPKIDATIELIDSWHEKEKTVIFSLLHSKQAIKALSEALKAKYGDNAVAVYTGDTPAEDRQEIIRQFQDPDSELKIFIGNNAAARGITLTAACKEIFFTAGYSADERMQAEDRCYRIGQKKVVEVYDIVARGTPDKVVLKTLERKKDLMKQLLDKSKEEAVEIMEQILKGNVEVID